MTINHWYIRITFLSITVQSKVAGVKLLKHALDIGQVETAPGQVETVSEMSEHGLENARF